MKKEIENIILEIKKRTKLKPEIGLILGSGWSSITHLLKNPVEIFYKDLPDMPVCTVKGHGGKFLIGKLFNKTAIIMQGRFHLYEGYKPAEVVIPVDVMYGLGVRKLIITNAAGGLNLSFKVGDIMIINDHINFTNQNPLVGLLPTEENPIFIGTTNTYNKRLKNAALKFAIENNIPIQTGVYAQVLGPNYETHAECNMLRVMGADAVAMSTVMEVLYAHYLKMEVFAMSCITNITGVKQTVATHEEVMDVTKQNSENLKKMLSHLIKEF